MIIDDPAAFRERFDAPLRTGPARVDRTFGADDREPGQVAVIAADRTVFWMLYRPETGRAYVFAVHEPGREPETATGAGCGEDGFRLAGDHPHLVLELLALTHRDLTIVRGQPGEFLGVGMP